jgi:AAA domain, putative AbiEii toxin, Type IV TA system/AAA ATPase domain
MLNSIRLQNFKGFRDTYIGQLRKVNLVVGGQNVGKTSLLEAIDIGWTGNSYSPFRPNEGNDHGRFGNNALGNKFEAIEINLLSGPVIGLRSSNGVRVYISGQPGPTPVPVPIPLFLPQQVTLVNLFGEVVLARKKRELTDLLRRVEPRLLSLDAISPDGEQRIYAEIDGVAQALPLPELGHGFARLLYLFCTLMKTQGSLALIDEVESGIHYSALPTLLEGIKVVAQQQDVQTIMTTHSMDCIKAASKVFEDSPEDFQVIRLVRTADNIEADIIPADAVQAVLACDGEVR